ncbi:DUF5977 domain-containing protein, partial [Flavobacterium aquidurense]|uniref:DUF5977 domain-containing protein n=1 Tax=Flavobacterium aquidurense TaxID=362413 RepID=UPI0037574377
NFTKNDCASGGYGSSVTFSQAAGVSSSNNSQAEADALGNIKFNQDGQAYANANGYCTFYSTALSGNFTKNDCASGGYGSSVTFSQAAGVSSSNNSQAEADALGNIKFNQDGQAYANANGYCTFYSTALSGNFTKNDCASGGYGSSVSFSQAAGVSSSNNSQAEADALGNIKFNQDGQAYANTNGYCTFYSVAISGNFTKGDCAPGGNGSDVYYSQGFGGASSTNSQAEADALGGTKFNQDGQAYANANGYCTFYSAAKSGQFTRNNCAADGVPGSVIYNVPARRYSDVSQAGADAQAQTDVNNNGQNYANTTALCTFYSVARSGLFSKNDCTGGALGSSVTFDQAAGAISSNISQDDANILGADKFYRDGNAYANASGTCAFYNTAVSRTANKNDCGAGRYGTAVTYTVPAVKYSSTISQANADQLAQNDLNNNYQNYINTNGACTSETYDTSIMDADSNLSRIWITVTSSSASHPDRKVNVVLTYSYRIGTKIYSNGRLSNNFILPAGVTSNTYIITLSFIGAPKLESYTIN